MRALTRTFKVLFTINPCSQPPPSHNPLATTTPPPLPTLLSFAHDSLSVFFKGRLKPFYHSFMFTELLISVLVRTKNLSESLHHQQSNSKTSSSWKPFFGEQIFTSQWVGCVCTKSSRNYRGWHYSIKINDYTRILIFTI